MPEGDVTKKEERVTRTGAIQTASDTCADMFFKVDGWTEGRWIDRWEIDG